MTARCFTRTEVFSSMRITHGLATLLLTFALLPGVASAQADGGETPDATYWELTRIDGDTLPTAMDVEADDGTDLQIVYYGATLVFRTGGTAALQLGLDVLVLDDGQVDDEQSVRGARVTREGRWAWSDEHLVFRIQDGGWADRSGGALGFGAGGEEHFRSEDGALVMEADLGGDHTFRFERFQPEGRNE